MRTIIETVYLQDMLVSGIMGITYSPRDGTTINEYLDIDIVVKDKAPKISHYTIGISTNELDATIDTIEHSPIDITLYEQIPLLLVDKDIGLTPTEEAEYDLKKEIIKNNKTYIACYAKKLNSVSNKTDMLSVEYNATNGTYSIDDFKYNTNELGKPSIKQGKDYTFSNESRSVAISSLVSVALSLKDVENILNSIEVLYANETAFIKNKILEVGIVASNDKNGYYQHTHYVKVNKFFNTLTLKDNNILDIDIGNMSPVNI